MLMDRTRQAQAICKMLYSCMTTREIYHQPIQKGWWSIPKPYLHKVHLLQCFCKYYMGDD
jgi:hypothetical protein